MIILKKLKNSFKSKETFLSSFKYLILPFLIASVGYCGNSSSGTSGSGIKGGITIVTQPVDMVIVPGTATTLNVIATTSTGTELKYEWQKFNPNNNRFDSVYKGNAPYSSYTTEELNRNTEYRVIISAEGANSVTSNVVTVKVDAIGIITQPISTVILPNNSARFDVVVTRAIDISLSYQWQKAPKGSNTYSDISGATATTYTTPLLTQADTGSQYRVIVSAIGLRSSITSEVATVTVSTIEIITQPTSTVVLPDTTATLSVAHLSGPPLSYQWQKAPKGSNTYSDISGATATTYTTPVLTQSDTGSQYRVILSGTNVITVTSHVATVTVSPISIQTHPKSITVASASSITLDVVASTTTGTTLSYQWQKSGMYGIFYNINAPTISSYTTVGSNAGQYRVIISGIGLTPVISNVATLTTLNITITKNLDLITAFRAGYPVTLDVLATVAIPNIQLRYQWQKKDKNNNVYFTNIVGATDASYTIPSPTESDVGSQYKVIVSADGFISTTSDTTSLETARLNITSQPTSSIIILNSNTARFYVTVSSNTTLNYQWQEATSGSSTFMNISGATSFSYTTPPLVVADYGKKYRVVVTSIEGLTATSDIAMIPLISTIGGTATFGLTEDTDGATGGITSRFNAPSGIAVDSAGNIYVADTDNHRIRKITPSGVTSTIAGSGVTGLYNGDFAEDSDGTTGGITSQFKRPMGIAVDSAGNIYVADTYNHRIRKITPSGVTSTIAGPSANIYNYDNGFAEDTDGTTGGITSRFNTPSGVAVDSAGNVYVADTYNHRIRKITPSGITSTIAGSGATDFDNPGFAEDSDGTTGGITSRFNAPSGVAVDSAGNVYVADTSNHRIRKITPSGITSTIAGSGYRGFGDNFAEDTDGTTGGITSLFKSPYGIAVDLAGNMYVADTSNHRIRKITPSGVTSTITAANFGNSLIASLDTPLGVAIDSTGNIYVANTNNHLIHKIME